MSGKGHFTHGLSRTRKGVPSSLYRLWGQIKQRCKNPKHKDFKDYGGRGINFYPSWEDFRIFQECMLSKGYVPGLTIERINNEGNYEPTNIAFIPNERQPKNTRRVVRITYNGKTQILSDWAKELGIKYSTINSRLQKDYSIETAFQKEDIIWNRKWNREARKKREIYPKRIRGRFHKDSQAL